jgi:pyruvate formate lyase activating enzyme
VSDSSQTSTVARFWTAKAGRVKCALCPHECLLDDGQTGLCNVRSVVDGELRSLVYGHPVGGAVDPVEKKPLFHFKPGSPTYSYATVGCNLACTFCQNYSLSQVQGQMAATPFVTPEELVEAAVVAGCRTIAHTYSEPTIFLEYALDVARVGNGRGLDSIFVTNGFIGAEARTEMAGAIRAANVDLKAFSDHTYRTVCRGRLQPVLDTIAALVKAGVWVEVTTLVVPGLNDSSEELGQIASFLASVSKTIPWHVSRFHPDYHMTDRSVTPAETLAAACAAGAKAGLHHVYVGNLPTAAGEDTHCPACQAVVIQRRRFTVVQDHLVAGNCHACGHHLAGVW